MKKILFCLTLAFFRLGAMQPGERMARKFTESPRFSTLIASEAERLIEVMLISPLLMGIPESDKEMILEIQSCLAKQEPGTNPIIQKAVALYKETVGKNVAREQKPSELLVRALSFDHNDPLRDEKVEEIHVAIRKRELSSSNHTEVNEAVSLYHRREGLKSKVLTTAKEGKTGELKEVLDNGISVDEIRDAEGNTALALAVNACKLSTVNVLLAAGAETNTVNASGMTPLDIACANGGPTNDRPQEWQDMITALEKKAAKKSVQLDSKKDLFSAMASQELFEAASRGGRKKLEELLKIYSPNLRDADGNSLVAIATKNRCLETVKFLVEKYGVDVNSLNKQNKTPIELTTHKLTIEYLRGHGALTGNEFIKKAAIFSNKKATLFFL